MARKIKLEVYITQEALDFISSGMDNGSIALDDSSKPKLGEVWIVSDMFVSSEYGLMLELTHKVDWRFLRLPAYLFYSDGFVKYLTELTKEK